LPRLFDFTLLPFEEDMTQRAALYLAGSGGATRQWRRQRAGRMNAPAALQNVAAGGQMLIDAVG
jgi:hypothetical protein